jgi:hypothetical protein
MTQSHTYHGSSVAWNPERLAQLRSLWATGLSASQIGDRIGISRNAVLGKIHRLGLGPKLKLAPAILSALTKMPTRRCVIQNHEFDIEVFCEDPALLASTDRLLQRLTSQTKSRKRRPATDIKRIEATTGKVVTGVTLGDDGRVASYTFAEAPATETNPFEAEAARLRALKRGSA